MDLATLLATFPPDVREDVLLNSEEAVLASLPPALLAEAQALRERSMRFMSGMGARHVHHIHDLPLRGSMHGVSHRCTINFRNGCTVSRGSKVP